VASSLHRINAAHQKTQNKRQIYTIKKFRKTPSDAVEFVILPNLCNKSSKLPTTLATPGKTVAWAMIGLK